MALKNVMKFFILLITLVFLFSSVAIAQDHNFDDSIASRMICDVEYQDNGTQFYPLDSVVFTYTGSNGSNSPFDCKFSKKEDFEFDSLSMKYDSTSITFQAFDANNNDTSFIIQSWNGTTSKWETVRRDIYTYDTNNNNVSAVINGIKYCNTYDLNNNNTSKITQFWNSTDLGWVNNEKDTNIYSENNKVVLTETMNWDRKKSVWIPRWKYYKAYNSHNIWNSATAMYLKRHKWHITSPYVHYIYCYNTKGRDSLDIELDYNFKHGSWDTTQRWFTIYGANNGLDSIETTQNWYPLSSTWRNDTRIIRGYDKNDNITTYLRQKWDTTDSKWRTDLEDTSTYNNFNQITSDTYVYYNNDKPTEKNYYYYQTYTTKRKSKK